MPTIGLFKEVYFISGLSLGFAEGRRKNLRYALENSYIYCTSINKDGPQPYDYLEYAKNNMIIGGTQGAIDSISNAKRTIHLIIRQFFKLFGLEEAYGDKHFPEQLKIIRLLNAFPTRMIDSLNKNRNIVEHDYRYIDIEKVKDFVDIAEMFLLLAYPYLRHAVVGAFVGIEKDNRCLEWKIDLKEHNIKIYKIVKYAYIKNEGYRLHYNISTKDEDKRYLNKIEIKNKNYDKWINYMDLFIYLTKSNISKLPVPDSRGDGMFLVNSGHTVWL